MGVERNHFVPAALLGRLSLTGGRKGVILQINSQGKINRGPAESFAFENRLYGDNRDIAEKVLKRVEDRFLDAIQSRSVSDYNIQCDIARFIWFQSFRVSAVLRNAFAPASSFVTDTLTEIAFNKTTFIKEKGNKYLKDNQPSMNRRERTALISVRRAQFAKSNALEGIKSAISEIGNHLSSDAFLTKSFGDVIIQMQHNETPVEIRNLKWRIFESSGVFMNDNPVIILNKNLCRKIHFDYTDIGIVAMPIDSSGFIVGALDEPQIDVEAMKRLLAEQSLRFLYSSIDSGSAMDYFHLIGSFKNELPKTSVWEV